MSGITGEARPVSLVIPTLNAGPRFHEVLAALEVQDVEGGCELLVVDSGSTDGTPEAAEAAGARVERIDPATFGHGRTRNLAIGRTSGELVALLTQDAVPMDPSYLSSLFGAFRRGNVDGVFSRQFPRPDCDPILTERLMRWSASRDTPELKVLAPGDPERARALFQALPPIERYLSAAFDNVASAVRRSTWERIPFPDVDFGEDVAWGREVLLAGGALAFEPDARVEHSHRISMLREFRRIYADHRNLRALFELVQVPSWRAVRSGGRGQCRHYAELLAAQRLTFGERLFWRAYSIPYAYLETAAQFLGAGSEERTAKSRFWSWFDRRVRTGI